MNAYAVILAGGKDERLWPASSPECPKPFLPLASGGRTLLRGTYDRILSLVGRDGVLVVAQRRFESRIATELDLGHERVLGEPEGQNTAPAIGLAALVLNARDPTSVMIALPPDHLILGEDRFRNALANAVALAEHGHLVTLGIEPDRPATGYGYIQRGEPLEGGGFRASRFIEKPDLPTAERLLASGGRYWNAGIFVWQTKRILGEIAQFLPRLSTALEKLRAHEGKAGWQETLATVWPEVEAISIDYGVMEGAGDAVVVPTEVGWSDVGDWAAVWEALPQDAAGVVALGEHIGTGTTRALVWGGAAKPVFTLGARKLIVVDTPEALLVADLELAQEVGNLARRAGSPSSSAEERLAEVRHLGLAQRTVDRWWSASTGTWLTQRDRPSPTE